MTSISSLLGDILQKETSRRKQSGRLGKWISSSSSWQFYPDDNDRPGFVIVRIERGGSSAFIEAINRGCPLLGDLPVTVVKNDMEVYEASPTLIEAEQYVGSNAVGMVAPHSHELGTGNADIVSGRRIKDGLIHVVSPTASMSITIERFSYVYGGLNRVYPGGTFDLTSYQPATTNTYAWVVIGFNPDTEAVEAAAGSEYSDLNLMDETQIKDISFEGRILLGALRLGEADTSISDERRFASNPDVRHFIGSIETIGLSKAVVGSDGNVVTMSGEVVWLL